MHFFRRDTQTSLKLEALHQRGLRSEHVGGSQDATDNKSTNEVSKLFPSCMVSPADTEQQPEMESNSQPTSCEVAVLTAAPSTK